MHQRWIDRCDKLKDPASEGGGRLHAELVHQITAMYELRERVNRFDQEIFVMPLQDRLLLPTRQLRIWATQFTPVIAKAVVTAQLQGMKGTSDIRKYFSKLPGTRIPRVRMKATEENQNIRNMMTQRTITDYTILLDDSDGEESTEIRAKRRTKTPHKAEQQRKYKEVSLETCWSQNGT